MMLGMGLGLGLMQNVAATGGGGGGGGGFRYVRLNVTDINSTLAFFGVVQVELSATIGGTNILPGKSYSFSSDESGNGAALFNGLNNTNALVGFETPDFPKTEWAQVDLGSAVSIVSGWVLDIVSNSDFTGRHPKDFELWLSNDPTFATKTVALHVTGASPAAGAGFQDNYYTLTAP